MDMYRKLSVYNWKNKTGVWKLDGTGNNVELRQLTKHTGHEYAWKITMDKQVSESKDSNLKSYQFFLALKEIQCSPNACL